MDVLGIIKHKDNSPLRLILLSYIPDDLIMKRSQTEYTQKSERGR